MLTIFLKMMLGVKKIPRIFITRFLFPFFCDTAILYNNLLK